jgi:hypothetical protein
MSLVSAIYHGVTKRTSTFAVAILASAFVFERSFDALTEYIYDTRNQGKQWKDIKHKYETSKAE